MRGRERDAVEGVGVEQRRKVCFSFESDFRHQGSHRLSPRDVAHGKSREPRGRARARSCARSVVSECARAREQAAARGHHIGSGATRPEVGAFQLVPEKAFYHFFLLSSVMRCDAPASPGSGLKSTRGLKPGLTFKLHRCDGLIIFGPFQKTCEISSFTMRYVGS